MRQNKGSYVFVFMLILIVIAISVISLYDAFFLLEKQRTIVGAKSELRQIGVASLGLYLQTRRVEVDRVWTLLGGIRKDKWGQPYRKDGRGKQTTWISAGPDREFGTRDDLRVRISELSGKLPSLNQTRNPVRETETVSAE